MAEFDVQKIKEDRLVRDWFTQRNLQDATKHTYAYGFAHFLRLVEKTPKELLEEAEAEIKNGTLMRERKLKEYLLRYREYLKKTVAPSSRSGYLNAVKSFYENYDIDLPKLKNSEASNLEQNKYNGMSVEDIRAVLSHTNSLKERALILAIVSSGMGEKEIVSLRVGQLKNVDNNGVCTLFMRRRKTDTDFISFLSPEAVKVINLYLEERNQDPKTRVLGDEDYIFITSPRYDKPIKENHTPMLPRNCMQIMAYLCKRMGRHKPKVYNSFRPHNFRKFFYNALIDNGCDYFFAEFLMGHKIDRTRGAYFLANAEKTKQKYLRYLPFLTVTETVGPERLETENEELRAKLVDMETSEVGKLKQEIESMKKDMDLTREFMELIKNDPRLLDMLKKLSNKKG